MKIFHQLSSVILLLSFNIYGMENNSIQVITQWEDARPFLKQFVTYTTASPYFGAYQGYQINPISSIIKFGYITGDMSSNAIKDFYNTNGAKPSDKELQSFPIYPYYFSHEERGYRLIKLLSKEDTHSDSYLLNSLLKQTTIQMRIANKREIALALKAINENLAQFDYSNEQALYALKQLVNPSRY